MALLRSNPHAHNQGVTVVQQGDPITAIQAKIKEVELNLARALARKARLTQSIEVQPVLELGVDLLVVMLDAFVAMGEGEAQLVTGVITQEQYDELVSEYDEAGERLDHHSDVVEEALFAEVEAEIEGLEAELQGLLAMEFLLSGGSVAVMTF